MGVPELTSAWQRRFAACNSPNVQSKTRGLYVGRCGADMLARSVERTVQEESEILGNQSKFLILFSDGRARENFQGGRQQPVVGPRMNDETCRERVAEFSRHRSEDRPLDMPIAVEEWMDFAEPAESVGQRYQLAEVVSACVCEKTPSLKQ